jgi:hypothetical protein
MNSQLEKALNAIVKLDAWDIQSTIGGVNYLVRQAAINQVVRLIPEPPEEGSGLEGFTKWEQDMKNPDIKKSVSPLVGVAERVTEVLNEYTTLPPSQYEDVLAFMLQRPPQRSTFVAEYDNRKRLGMRPSMPLNTFVDMEYATALGRHQNLVAKGEAAVQLLEAIEGEDGAIPEWLQESIDNKLQQKLAQRWYRAEMRRTNPKITKNDRDIAAANQLMIEGVIEELGGSKPTFSEEMAASDDMDQFIETMRAKVPTSPTK